MVRRRSILRRPRGLPWRAEVTCLTTIPCPLQKYCRTHYAEKVHQSMDNIINLKEQFDEKNEVIRQVPVELELRKYR